MAACCTIRAYLSLNWDAVTRLVIFDRKKKVSSMISRYTWRCSREWVLSENALSSRANHEFRAVPRVFRACLAMAIFGGRLVPSINYPLAKSRGLNNRQNLSAMMWRESLRAMWNFCFCFVFFAQSFGILSKMNLEEEVFKIGKQLEKIVGQDGAVRQTFVV